MERMLLYECLSVLCSSHLLSQGSCSIGYWIHAFPGSGIKGMYYHARLLFSVLFMPFRIY